MLTPNSTSTNLILYGPPGVGKSTLGPLLAQRLGFEFIDGDRWLEAHWGRRVGDYYAKGEEALFRAREVEAYRLLAAHERMVLAPGGGALLNPHTRATLEGAGVILCLRAQLETLLERLPNSTTRPLFAGDPRARLTQLLEERAAFYQSFPIQLVTDGLSVDATLDRALALYQARRADTYFHLNTPTPSQAILGHAVLQRLPDLLPAEVRPPFLVIADSNVAPLYGAAVAQALGASLATFAAGEKHKTLDTVHELYRACVAHHMERSGTLVAVGGGVVGDVVGFVAATFMRGVRWVNLPTTVLAMADAAIGGKVGVDLPEGKNLVGAFHPPALILADFDTLPTLPEAETRNGLAEVFKSALIGDPALFQQFTAPNPVPVDLAAIIRRAAAVKVGIVNTDPYEAGERALLNLGHTVGHAVEVASGFQLRHGEAVAVGLVAAARIAEASQLASANLTEATRLGLQRLGLPTRAPGLDPDHIFTLMKRDKKKAEGQLKFVLAKQPGDLVRGVVVSDALLVETLTALTQSAE